MVLSDKDLRRLVAEGRLGVNPPPSDDCFQPASLELRLGRHFIVYRRFLFFWERCLEVYLQPGQDFILHPGDFVLAHTRESLEIPLSHVARVEGKSSLGRLAIVVHLTAGWVDPKFKGQITLEMKNLRHVPMRLREGMKICQLALMPMWSLPEEGYGKGNHYQGQTGATPSALKVEVSGGFLAKVTLALAGRLVADSDRGN